MQTTTRPAPKAGFSYCNPTCYCRNCKLVEKEARTATTTSASPTANVNRLDCGHHVPAGTARAAYAMSASTGSSCPSCYDRMS